MREALMGGWPGRIQCPLCGASAPDPAAWLTLRAFADHHGLSRSTLWRWRSQGLVMEQRIDGRIRVRLVDERSRW